jgi:hypothetical protein
MTVTMGAVTAAAEVNDEVSMAEFPDAGKAGDCAAAGACRPGSWGLVRRYRWVLKALTKTVVETALKEELFDPRYAEPCVVPMRLNQSTPGIGGRSRLVGTSPQRPPH